MTIPDKYKTDGEGNSDVHIWVIYDVNENSGVLANAVYCELDETLKRVNFGRVRVNMGRVGKDESNAGFESDLNTVIHECVHIFAFSGGLFPHWVNPETGDFYGGDDVKKILKTGDIRGKKTYILSSKNVLETARKYYGCPSLEGM